MSVAGTAAAGIEAAAAGGSGRSGGGGGRDTGGSGGGWGTEEVASTSTTRVGVAVLGNSRVGLGDGVERRHFDVCCCAEWCGAMLTRCQFEREEGSLGQETLLLLLLLFDRSSCVCVDRVDKSLC